MNFLKNKENILVLAIVALVLLLSFGRDRAELVPATGLMQTESPTLTETPDLMVHITGRVKNPGVYVLKPEARLLDAVSAAGGFEADADENGVNLSMRLKDEDRIHIPAQGEEGAAAPVGGLVQQDDGLIDLNTATQQELESLPGIGPALSGRIIDYREQTPFGSIEEVKNVSGIGDKLFEGMKELITVR